MTDMIELAHEQYDRIEWQTVPDDVTREDLTGFIARGIRDLYVKTGRAANFDEEMFTRSGDLYSQFSQTLPLDEQQYVLVSAEIFFYSKVQKTVDTLTSYSTDALSVTHGDKPFANLQQTISDLKVEQRQIWYKMTRYHHL